jgi:molybdate transport system ATP-binding protein
MSLNAKLTIPRQDFDINIDLNTQASDFTAIFGTSGSGKTSLMRAIAGLEKAATGHVQVGDEIWQDETYFKPPHERNLGFVFQDARLFPHLNVKENLLFGRKRQSRSNLRVSLETAIDLLGLSHLLHRPVDELSGGEKQRVAIARAVATSPNVLLFDEPLAAVDWIHKQEILRYIQSLHRELNIPILYVSHAIDEVARLSDNLILLSQGQQLASGRTADLMADFAQPFAHYEGAASLIDAHVFDYDPQYDLTEIGFLGGKLAVHCRDVAVGDPIRVRLMAKDVSLSTVPPATSSILNTLSAHIDDMTVHGDANVLIRLRVGPHIILSRITRKSADILKLAIGQRVYAQVKAVSLLC